MATDIALAGMGNVMRSDDGIGPWVVKALAKRFNDDIKIVPQIDDAMDLMNFWSDCRLAIIVDAISADKPAGEIFEINNADFLEADPGLLSSHGGGIVEAWKLSEAIGSLPQKLIVFGIVGKNFNSGTEICDAVQAAGEQLVERITQRLEEELVQDA